MKTYFYICVIFFNSFCLAQSSLNFSLVIEGEHKYLVVSDTLEFTEVLSQTKEYYLSKGYLEIRIDSIVKNSVERIAYFFKGKKYKWINIKSSINKEGIALATSFEVFDNKYVRVEKLMRVREDVIDELNNTGYPYAKLFFSDFSSKGDSLFCKLTVDPGERVYFDVLDVNSEFIKDSFLQSYLGVKFGDLFSKEKIVLIPYLLMKLKGVDLDGEIKTIFYKNVCKVDFDLKKKEDDLFDGLVGLQTNELNKSEVVGNVSLSLNNLFKSNKKISVLWRKPTQLNQAFDISVDCPNVFNSNLGIKGGIDLLKRDTTFLNVNLGLGIYYLLKKQKVGAEFQRNQSSLFTDDISSDSLKSFKGITSLVYYQYDNLYGDRLKLKGIKIIFSIGNQSVNFNDSINNVNIAKLKIDFEGWHPFLSYLTLKQKITGFNVLARTPLVNQMEFVGGFKSLRGFNENQFVTSKYLIGTSSVIAHVGDVSNFSLFSDYGVLLTNYGLDYVFSTGFGIELLSDNSSLQFAYAIGRNNNQGFSLGLSKIHVGIATKI